MVIFEAVRRFAVILYLISLFLAKGSLAQTPTVAASNIGFTNVYCNELEISWTNGDGIGRLVIANTSPIDGDLLPKDGNFYIASDSFGKGEHLGGGNFVLYNGSGAKNSLVVKRLKHQTTYYFTVIEFNGSGSNLDYLTTGYSSANTTTEYIYPSFTINNSGKCFNGHNSIYSNTTDSSVSGISYKWDYFYYGSSTKTDGSATTYSASHVYSEPGLFRVSLTTTSTGCYNSTFEYDSIFFHPEPEIITEIGGGVLDTFQCFTGNVRFTLKAKAITGNVGGRPGKINYQWDFDNGAPKETDAARVATYTEPGVYNVQLVATSLYNAREFPGCTDTVYQTLIVMAPPLDTTLIDIPDTVQCVTGNQFTFNNNNPKIQSQTWDFGDGNTSNMATNMHSYAGQGKYYITLQATDTFGCSDTYVDSVRVISRPNASFTGLLPEYCLDDPASTLVPSTSGGTFYVNGVSIPDDQFVPNRLGTVEVVHEIVVGSCGDQDTQTTVINAAPVYELGMDTTICNGDSILLSIGPNGTYTWSTGESSQSVWVRDAGLVWGRVSQNACVYRDSLTISLLDAPVFEFGSDTSLCGDKTLTLTMTGEDAVFSWSTGEMGSTIVADETGVYQGTATNKCGTYTDEIEVTIAEFACNIFMPNAFSPNGDNINNVFRPFGKYEFISLEVYTRWGEKVYESFTNEEWDGYYNGVPIDEGTYVYKYILKVDQEGEMIIKPFAGTVNVFW